MILFLENRVIFQWYETSVLKAVNFECNAVCAVCFSLQHGFALARCNPFHFTVSLH